MTVIVEHFVVTVASPKWARADGLLLPPTRENLRTPSQDAQVQVLRIPYDAIHGEDVAHPDPLPNAFSNAGLVQSSQLDSSERNVA